MNDIKIKNELEKIFKETSVYSNGRRHYKGELYSHIVWNLYNPDNKKVKGDKCNVHHKDGNWSNDNIENLQKLSLEEHASVHHKGKIVSKETKRKLSLSKIGNKHNLGKTRSEETRRKISESITGEKHPMFGKHYSEEARRNMSLGHKKKKLGLK